MGEIWETNDAVLTVPISNRTDKDIAILDFETSCDCGEISPRQLVVPANGTAEVKVNMDLTKRAPQQIAMIKRKLTLQFKPISSSKLVETRLTIFLISKASCHVDTTPIDFDDWRRQGGNPVTRRIKLKYFDSNCKISCQSENPNVTAVLIDDPEGHSYVAVTPNSKSPVGSFDSRILISVQPSRGVAAKYSVSCTGTIAEPSRGDKK